MKSAIVKTKATVLLSYYIYLVDNNKTKSRDKPHILYNNIAKVVITYKDLGANKDIYIDTASDIAQAFLLVSLSIQDKGFDI